MEPLASLGYSLAQAGGLRRFIETGTYLGASLPWASANFEQVWTIEINPDYQRQAMQTVGPLPNVTFLLGNSRDHIAKLCRELDGPALFWLDAHAGAGFFGQEKCPLLEELKAVLSSRKPHCILVDEARVRRSPENLSAGEAQCRGWAAANRRLASIPIATVSSRIRHIMEYN